MKRLIQSGGSEWRIDEVRSQRMIVVYFFVNSSSDAPLCSAPKFTNHGTKTSQIQEQKRHKFRNKSSTNHRISISTTDFQAFTNSPNKKQNGNGTYEFIRETCCAIPVLSFRPTNPRGGHLEVVWTFMRFKIYLYFWSVLGPWRGSVASRTTDERAKKKGEDGI